MEPVRVDGPALEDGKGDEGDTVDGLSGNGAVDDVDQGRPGGPSNDALVEEKGGEFAEGRGKHEAKRGVSLACILLAVMLFGTYRICTIQLCYAATSSAGSLAWKDGCERCTYELPARELMERHVPDMPVPSEPSHTPHQKAGNSEGRDLARSASVSFCTENRMCGRLPTMQRPTITSSAPAWFLCRRRTHSRAATATLDKTVKTMLTTSNSLPLASGSV